MLSLLMAFILIFSTQMQITAPASEKRAQNTHDAYDLSDVYAETTEKTKGKSSDARYEPELLSSSEKEKQYSYISNKEDLQSDGDNFSAEDVIANAQKNLTVIGESGENNKSAVNYKNSADNENADTDENTERDGVTIVPASVNNVIRDSLPSLISTKIYTFSISERGVIIYAFNHINKADKDCMWYITLYEEYSTDGSGGSIAYREINRAVYSSVGESVQSPSLGILPGNYRLSVACISGYTDEKYDLVIGFAHDDSYEIECNDTQTRYTWLPLDKNMNGSASEFTAGMADTDWYMFEITETGYAVLYFNHDVDANASADSVAWRISIVDEEGREYFRTNSSMSTSMLNSGVMGLSPGYYFVSVSSQVFTGVTYSLNVSFTSDESIEREMNDTPEKATPISVNTEIIGSLTERDALSDRDYYTFTMENDGFVVIDFIHEALSEQHDGWNITVISSAGATVYSAVSDWTQTVTQSPNLGLPAGVYCIRIDSDGIYRSGIVYRLALLNVQDSAWESEPNNTTETADELILGTPINGTLVETGVNYDRDFFAFNVQNDGKINVSFSHIKTQGDNKQGWIISVIDENGDTVAEESSYWDSGEITFAADVKSGKYYAVVETGLYFNSARYVLTIDS